MSRVSPMGLALRELRGDQVVADGPVEVMTRCQDFNILDMQGPEGPVSVPAQSLIAFTAQSFRELAPEADRGQSGELDADGRVRRPSDVWEFRVQGSDGAYARMYLQGADILLVKAPSKVV